VEDVLGYDRFRFSLVRGDEFVSEEQQYSYEVYTTKLVIFYDGPDEWKRINNPVRLPVPPTFLQSLRAWPFSMAVLVDTVVFSALFLFPLVWRALNVNFIVWFVVWVCCVGFVPFFGSWDVSRFRDLDADDRCHDDSFISDLDERAERELYLRKWKDMPGSIKRKQVRKWQQVVEKRDGAGFLGYKHELGASTLIDSFYDRNTYLVFYDRQKAVFNYEGGDFELRLKERAMYKKIAEKAVEVSV
jgi:hypothetical protein